MTRASRPCEHYRVPGPPCSFVPPAAPYFFDLFSGLSAFAGLLAAGLDSGFDSAEADFVSPDLESVPDLVSALPSEPEPVSVPPELAPDSALAFSL